MDSFRRAVSGDRCAQQLCGVLLRRSDLLGCQGLERQFTKPCEYIVPVRCLQ